MFVLLLPTTNEREAFHACMFTLAFCANINAHDEKQNQYSRLKNKMLLVQTSSLQFDDIFERGRWMRRQFFVAGVLV